MSDKEKRIQVALGLLDIPKLVPIELHKVNKTDNTHPDLKEEEDYLVRVDGQYRTGFVDPDGGGIFCVGQYEQCIDDCSAIWLIKGGSN